MPGHKDRGMSDPKRTIKIMTSTTVDVNQAFADERVQQIASAYQARDAAAERFSQRAAQFDARIADGKMRDNGNGTFTVTDPGSWDDGEVFRMVRPTPESIPLILPQTGLDTLEDGRSALYTSTPSWHATEGIGLIEGGTTEIGTVLQKGGIDFLVMQEPVNGAVSGEVPGAFINYRSDTKAPLGVVGKIYTPWQPRQQLGFLQELAERYDIPFESAGSMNGGKQVFVSMKVPESIGIDVEGINDEVQLFFAAINSNDGEGKGRVVATPWRPVCGNTNRFALRDAVTSWGWRHTKAMPDRIAEAQRQLGLVFAYGENFQKEETQLARTEVTLGQVEQLVAQIWESLPADATDRQRRTHEARLDKVFERFALETTRVGRTAYAAENAVTGYLDHDASRKAKPVNMAAARATASMLGADDDKKAKAHKLLLTLAS
jgi:phage/plasmid-like protein (TIGR03299 family)